MKYVRRYAWVFYLGTILSVLGHSPSSWQWWVVVVPVVVMVGWSKWGDIEPYLD